MKLITELNEDVSYLEEDAGNGKKNMYITGVFLQSAIQNRNGRIYPEEVMDREVARYIKESVNTKRAMGELGHPNGPQINLDRVSHLIVELTKNGTDYLGKARLADTPSGRTAMGLINCGAQIGVSSRALGSLKQVGGIMEVQNDFRLSTAADIVADPSAPSALIQGIMEGVSFVYDEAKNTFVEQKIEEIKREIKSVPRHVVEERKAKMFESYLETLSKR